MPASLRTKHFSAALPMAVITSTRGTLMRSISVALTAVAIATSTALPAHAADETIGVGRCSVAYTGQLDQDLRICSLISIGTFGTFSIAGTNAWGNVDCVVGGSSGVNYGGLKSFRTVPGDLCTLHVYTANFSHGAGTAWTFN